MADTLPKLREDIELSQVSQKEWTLFDRATSKYYRLNELTLLILSNFSSLKCKEEVVEKVSLYLPCSIADVDEVIEFCQKSFLVQNTSSNVERLIHVNQKLKIVPWYKKLVHGYLFFKIHLFNPNRFLDSSLTFIKPVFSTTFFWSITLFFIINTIFIVNRFSEFMATLTNFQALIGAMLLVLSIAIVKFFHELGHAYTAKYYGCNVPSMGIAFMVFYPMPYTDTSDAWRLSKEKRMRVAMAGVKTEMAIASLAMFMWLNLPEGTFKSLTFFIVGVSLISTIVVNLTPFMRFDGYYVVSDYLGIENLHNRSFAQAKAFLKRYLWGIEVPVEAFNARIKNFLILFAFTTWIYRFILFSGIAYLVYSHTFKALGIILFWIEVWYFILRPIMQEIKEWYSMRSAIKIQRSSLIVWSAIFLFGSIFFIPYSTSLHIPAVIETNSKKLLYSEYDSQVIYVHQPGFVKRGELILSAQTISNDLERQSALRKLQMYHAQSVNAFVMDNTLQDADKYRQSASAEMVKIKAAESVKTNMNIVAPIDGYLSFDEPISEGQYIGMAQQIGRILDPKALSISAYIEDIDLSLIHKGDVGELYDMLSSEQFSVKVSRVEMSPEGVLNEPLLNSTFKGSITVGKDNVPQRPYYKVHLLTATSNIHYPILFKRVGEIKLTIKYGSFFNRIVNETLSIAIRESQF